VLKIDKAFVADIDATGRKKRDAAGGAAIVSAVIGLARGLGLDVVAEGVERPAQLEFLRREGCRGGQGYLFCKPLPASQFEAWLKEHEAKAKAPEARRPRKRAARKPARKSPRNRNARAAKRRV
jgi:EAL domain-containing protein (putative c-di-GMP-specific phosphodiesterase class I)